MQGAEWSHFSVFLGAFPLLDGKKNRSIARTEEELEILISSSSHSFEHF